MLRISKLTDYGTVILATLAGAPERRHTASEVAERTRLGVPTVSKLLKSFHRAGIVTSERGTRGGYQLARPAARISAAAIIDAIEGPVAITECSGNHSACDIETTLGGEFLPVLGDQAAVGRADAPGDGGHLGGCRHLQVHAGLKHVAQGLDIPILDMAAILAQM